MHVPNIARNTLIGFLGSFNTPYRREIVREINLRFNAEICSDKYNPNKIEWFNYLSSLNIGISVTGVWASFRYYEIPWFGALLATDIKNPFIVNNFIPDEECIAWEDAEDLYNKVEELKHNPEKLLKLRLASNRACKERHLSIHRAKQILDDMGLTYVRQ